MQREETWHPMSGNPEMRRTESLDYIQTMLGQLRDMAAAERLDMLTYLVEMAYVEASDIIRGGRPLRQGPPRGAGRLQ
jgi:hypothetical protein